MPNSSSSSVRHDAVPREQVVEAARAWASRLRATYPEILRVGYFGSYAAGNYVPGSDFDVLIEVSESVLSEAKDLHLARRTERADRYRPRGFPVAVEAFVYTTEELQRARSEGSAFLAKADRQIVWLK